MCGIVAYYSERITESHLSEAALSLKRMEHRGYITEFEKINHNCILGTRRLPIKDPENGKQPFSNETEDVFVVFNGEIYNYEILLNQLKSKGHKFKSESDTEVIVHLWEEYGSGLVNYIEGMFAIIVFDKKSNTLFAVRDHIGIKPLYFTQEGSETIMCSELKAFPQNKIKSINELKPSTFYLNGKVYKYLTKSKLSLYSLADSHKPLVQLIQNSVIREVNTNLPIAVFYSGGIDSTIILELANKNHPNVTAITVGMEGSEDLKIARDYCQTQRINHIVRCITENEIKANLNKIIYHVESFEPNLVRAATFTYFMAETAKLHGFKIALSGEGCDELFFGYADFLRMSYSKADRIAAELTNDLFRTQLHRLDRCTMAHTIETRVPFLDSAVIEFSKILPVESKLNGKPYENKKILREAFKEIVGQQVSERPKNPMDEGAVPGGKNALSQLFNDLAVKSCVSEEYKEKYNLNILSLNEESYYLESFLSFGFDNAVSQKRIKVRKH
jgi:asparagine synthase (glutamine-hydrolysing)